MFYPLPPPPGEVKPEFLQFSKRLGPPPREKVPDDIRLVLRMIRSNSFLIQILIVEDTQRVGLDRIGLDWILVEILPIEYVTVDLHIFVNQDQDVIPLIPPVYLQTVMNLNAFFNIFLLFKMSKYIIIILGSSLREKCCRGQGKNVNIKILELYINSFLDFLRIIF